MKAFILLFFFFSLARAEPFIAKVSFGIDYRKWSIACFYVINIEKDVITFYQVFDRYFTINSREIKELPYFDGFIRQNKEGHSNISHLGIEKNHFHAKFTKNIEQEIIKNFLNFIEVPASMMNMIVEDFEAYNKKDSNSLSDKHEYYLYDVIGRHPQIISKSSL